MTFLFGWLLATTGCLFGPGDTATGCRNLDSQDVRDETVGYFDLPPLVDVPGAGDATYAEFDGDGVLTLTRTRFRPTAIDQIPTPSALTGTECPDYYAVQMDLELQWQGSSLGAKAQLRFDHDASETSHVAWVPMEDVETDEDPSHPETGEAPTRVRLELTQTELGWIVDLDLYYIDGSNVPWTSLDLSRQ